ncbi:MAG: DUF1836 domain-containing protein [Eubacteriales bacterium]|nr:DUF1836 domain-containing protein [Eubacteriales bacterium]
MNDFSFKDLKKQIDQWIQLDYIVPEDIPSIELYMDQITTFMEHQLSGNKRRPEDKIMTKTMINNYSKNDLLPPSTKKKYSKDHIILLIYIYYLKNFLSIGDIEQLLKPMTEQHFQSNSSINMATIYEDIFRLEQEYGIKVHESIHEIYEIADTHNKENNDYIKIFSMIVMLSYDIYAKKQLVEKLIDSFFPAPITKAEAKELAKQEAKAKEKNEKKSKK